MDLECKASLQKILKPVNYPAIDVWMRNHGIKEKKGILLLAEAAVGDNGVPVEQDKAFAALQQPVRLNPKGRHRVADAVHVTADRIQHDLTKVRSGEDQRNKDLVKKRRFASDFVSIPSTESISDFYRLADVAVSQEPGAKVLNEDAKRGLTRWQIRAPERAREETATICQALRSIGQAVEAVPRYEDHLRIRKPGTKGTLDCLFDQGEVKRAFRSGNYERRLPMMVPGAGLSRSMPTIPPAYVSEKEITDISRPGGYVVGLMDCEPLQMKKNKQRNITSKLVQGGATSWTTSNTAYGLDAHKA